MVNFHDFNDAISLRNFEMYGAIKIANKEWDIPPDVDFRRCILSSNSYCY